MLTAAFSAPGTLSCFQAFGRLMSMTEDEHIERHLEICQRVYERLIAEGVWSWSDSPKSEDVVESEDLSSDV